MRHNIRRRDIAIRKAAADGATSSGEATSLLTAPFAAAAAAPPMAMQAVLLPAAGVVMRPLLTQRNTESVQSGRVSKRIILKHLSARAAAAGCGSGSSDSGCNDMSNATDSRSPEGTPALTASGVSDGGNDGCGHDSDGTPRRMLSGSCHSSGMLIMPNGCGLKSAPSLSADSPHCALNTGRSTSSNKILSTLQHNTLEAWVDQNVLAAEGHACARGDDEMQVDGRGFHAEHEAAPRAEEAGGPEAAAKSATSEHEQPAGTDAIATLAVQQQQRAILLLAPATGPENLPASLAAHTQGCVV